MEWEYNKLKEDGKIETVSNWTNDPDGKITGHFVMNVKAWFDENPEECRRLGWTKHILLDRKEIKYNKQTQFLVITTSQVDEYTIRDEYHIIDKSEEQLEFEEMYSVATGEGGITFFGDVF